jgi:hypothetical protein
MYFDYTLSNFIILFLIGATLLTGCLRFRLSLESNWPLAYYAVLLSYWHGSFDTLDSYWVMAGLICGIVLRFEILGAPVERLFRCLELLVFIYIIRESTALLFRW